MPSPDLSGSGADLYIIKGQDGKMVRRVVKKCAYSRSLKEQVEFESGVMSCLSGNDFAAKFVSSDSESITYEYIQGRELFYSADGKRMGEALAMLHDFSSSRQITFAKYQTAKGWISSALERNSAALESKSSVSMAAKKFAQVQLAEASKSISAVPSSRLSRGCIVHNDLTARNILIDEKGKARLIDWCWALHSDAVLDALSYTCPIITSWEYPHFMSGGQMKEFFSAYFAGRKMGGDAKKAFARVFSLLCMPYFAAMAGWALSDFVGGPNHLPHQAHIGDAEFLKKARGAAEEISKRCQSSEFLKASPGNPRE